MALGFSASTRQYRDITVVDVRGRFTLIEGEAIHELIADLFRDGRKKVLLNLRDVSYLDSSGLAQLVRALCTARKTGAELKAVDLSLRAGGLVPRVGQSYVAEPVCIWPVKHMWE